uniref:Anoctamin n=1 Tax=Lygus hesperus TaxID=30085 RepID=A0A146LAE4_LYGHE
MTDSTDNNADLASNTESLEMVSLQVKPAKWNEVNNWKEEDGSNLNAGLAEEGKSPLLSGSTPAEGLRQGVSHFEDRVRTVDYVLAWDTSITPSDPFPENKREVYQRNLIGEGLELEEDHEYHGKEGDPDAGAEGSNVSTLKFIKIHVPKNTMANYAEILKFRQPIRKELCANFQTDDSKSIIKKHMVYDEGPILQEQHEEEVQKSRRKTYLQLLGRHKSALEKFLHQHIYVDSSTFPPVGFRYSTTYSRDKHYLFDDDEDNFFTPTSRARVAHFILDRTEFEEPPLKDPHAFGISRLINLGVYTAAYPLHDGDFKTEGTLRHTLLNEWGSVKRWYRYQPLDYIKDYFGVKVALYFCWLGFYTCMLFPAAIIGLIVFLSGFIHVDSSVLSKEVCDDGDKTIMCPLCDKFCDFWFLNQSCTYSTILSVFDNGTTVFFAAFMSIWAVLFLELWKRYSAEVTHRWDLTGYDTHEEVARPQYLARVERYYTMKKNKVTGQDEKRVPYWTVKLPATFFSFSVVALLVILAVVACVGVIVYRMAMITASAFYGVDVLGPQLSSHALVIINITAGVLNLIALMVLTWLYDWVALVLTEFEMVRTQSEFDDSLTFKMYLLQFINYYTSIFYLAFIKGKFIGYPKQYTRLFNIRQEECDTGGCLFEVTAQLAIIMVGKQVTSTFLELVYPVLMKYWRAGFKKQYWKGKLWGEEGPQWVQDYFLEELDIFSEYLEMVLQFGFVTIFVSAFPLAPLCALVNNLFESRCDAKKILMHYRRPVAVRVKSIGVWLTILNFVSKFAVFSNALIIAFTSEFIPHLVYRFSVSPNWSLEGYTNHSLSYMNTTELDWIGHNKTKFDVDVCRYKDYRYPPEHPNKYAHTTMYWTVLASRLIFMVLFENIVVFLVLLISWAIPDIPGKLKDKIRREAHMVNHIMLEEARKSKRDCGKPDMDSEAKGDDYKNQDGKADNGYTSDFSTENLDLACELGYDTKGWTNAKNAKRGEKWEKDLSKPPHDEALVHRPSNYGEISEETV